MNIIVVKEGHKKLEYINETIDLDVKVINTDALSKVKLYLKHFEIDMIIMCASMVSVDYVEELRHSGNTMPIIIIEVDEKVDRDFLYNIGVDEIISNDVSVDSIVCKVKAIHRRMTKKYTDFYYFGETKFEPRIGLLSNPSEGYSLTKKESNILEYLIQNQNIVVSKSQLIDAVWGNKTCEDNNVEVYISYLRKKLKYISNDIVIETKRKYGYTLIYKNELS
jgi:DNA-binding response OmpR family regulator